MVSGGCKQIVISGRPASEETNSSGSPAGAKPAWVSPWTAKPSR
jgi:hypothetical protein